VQSNRGSTVDYLISIVEAYDRRPYDSFHNT